MDEASVVNPAPGEDGFLPAGFSVGEGLEFNFQFFG